MPTCTSHAPGIEDLCSKRDELQKQILVEEEEKQRVQNDLRILTERLAQINEGLAQKIAMRNDYDRTISETENAYKKVCSCNVQLYANFSYSLWDGLLTHPHTHPPTRAHCTHTHTHDTDSREFSIAVTSTQERINTVER